MQNNIDRARLFHPFAALKGYDEVLRQMEKIVDDRIFLEEDTLNILNNKLQKIKIGDVITVKYYYGLEYIKTTGPVKRIDKIYKKIEVLNSKIKFDDIVDISIVK